MPKARVYELAKDLGVENKELIAYLAGLGADVKNHMSTVDESFAELARRRFSPTVPLPGSTAKAVKPRPVGLPPRVQRGPRGVRRPGASSGRTAPPGGPVPDQPGAEAVPEAKQPVRATTTPSMVSVPSRTLEDKSEVERERPARSTPVPKERQEASESAERPAPSPAPPQAASPAPAEPSSRDSKVEEGTRRRPSRQRRRPESTSTGASSVRQAPEGEPDPAKRHAPSAPDRRAVAQVRPVQKRRDLRDDESKADAPEEVTPRRRRSVSAGGGYRQATRPTTQNGRPQTARTPGGGRSGARPAPRRRRAPAQATQAPAPLAEETGPKVLVIPDTITVAGLAGLLRIPATTVIKSLMAEGVMAAINNVIDFEVASVVAEKLGAMVERPKVEDRPVTAEIAKEDELVTRPPVVTILGHVDHGKTTLLDAIRQTKVVDTEAGGITQHIGAYQVEENGRLITFLDTPGHEAFTEMRSRGAQVTDIAILVVAADDGVMPQTVEALNHAKAAGVPVIVAINKIDRPGANPDRVKQQLAEHGLLAEDWGGDTVTVEVSALQKLGIDALLEMVLLVADMAELRANPNRSAAGTVIEAELDKTRGSMATVLVQNGTLRAGDALVAGSTAGRVRAMFDYLGRVIKEAGPSVPVSVLGLEGVPAAGDLVEVVADDRTARERAEERATKRREAQRAGRFRLSELFARIQEGEVKDLNIVLKADVQGSAEALTSSLEKLSDEKVRVNVIHVGTGGITETDVALAAASNAIIIGFNVRPEPDVRRAAEREDVDIRLYRIIYEAIDDIEAAMTGLLDPEFHEVVLGRAEVRATFRVPNVGTVAGCYVTDGKIVRNALVRVLRDSVIVYEGKINSLKRFKDDVREVNEGYECGIGIERYNDIKEGDHLEAYQMQEVKS